MSRFSQEKFLEAYKRLSDAEKNILMSESLADKIIDLAKKNNLPDEIEVKIADEIGGVITKLEPKEKLAANIASYAGVQNDIAQNIAKDILNFIASAPATLNTSTEDDNSTVDDSSVAEKIIHQFALEGDETAILKEEVASIESGMNTVQDLRKHLVNSGSFSYDQSIKIANAVKQLMEGSQEQEEVAPVPVAAKPVPQAPANLPTQATHENILLRQTETPVYKLPDHAQMKEEHTHTPTQNWSQSSSQPIQRQAPQTIVDQKLSQIVKLPKEEVTVDLDALEQKRKTSYRGNDPYREPTE